MLGRLSDFIIFNAILDYELSLIYDIREEPQFWTIMMRRCIERNWRILFVPLNFVNVGMPRWFYDLQCNYKLWIPR